MQTIIQQLVTRCFKEDGATAADINDGNCEWFAFEVARLVPGAMATLDPEEQAHWFVTYNGKYYDSERPNGLENWRNLPCIQRDRALRALLKRRSS